MERLTRHRERGRDARAELDAVLDAGFVATLATVADGRPWVVPMLYARSGDRVLLHGSTGAGALQHVADGAPVALCVTHLDGIVVAHSTFDSSANYRSAVVHGTMERLTGEEAASALDALSNAVIPGRVAEVRSPTAKERAATVAMALPILPGRWTVKVRSGGPGEPDETDEAQDVWCGVVPVAPVYGRPEPAPWSAGPLPASVAALVAGDRW
jgi:nitroimidazol reductase NimA-like FMN-containing flavoprotein (pyridoxamine 5'-phosphate oxidase superfamily)